MQRRSFLQSFLYLIGLAPLTPVTPVAKAEIAKEPGATSCKYTLEEDGCGGYEIVSMSVCIIRSDRSIISKIEDRNSYSVAVIDQPIPREPGSPLVVQPWREVFRLEKTTPRQKREWFLRDHPGMPALPHAPICGTWTTANCTINITA